jgi:hypothetical protein
MMNISKSINTFSFHARRNAADGWQWHGYGFGESKEFNNRRFSEGFLDL